MGETIYWKMFDFLPEKQAYSTLEELSTVKFTGKTNLWKIWAFLSLKRYLLPSVPRSQQASKSQKGLGREKNQY